MKPEEEIQIVSKMIEEGGPRWIAVRPREEDTAAVLIAFEPRAGYRVWLPERQNRGPKSECDPDAWTVERIMFDDQAVGDFFAAFGAHWRVLLASELVEIQGPPCKVRAFVGNAGPTRGEWSISLDVPKAGAGREPLITLREIRTEAFRVCTAKADDRCWMDLEKLCGLLGVPFDARVGDKSAMLENCRRFIDQKCEGGGWPSYAELEAIVRATAQQSCVFSSIHPYRKMEGPSPEFERCAVCWAGGEGKLTKEDDPIHDFTNDLGRCQNSTCLPCRSRDLVDLFGTILALPSHRDISAPLELRDQSDPEANGRAAEVGQQRWTMWFTLDSGRECRVHFGREGAAHIRKVIMDEFMDEILAIDGPSSEVVG